MLRQHIFGIGYSNLRESEKIYENNRSLIVHLHGCNRINSLFRINDVNPFVLDEGESKLIAAGKMSIVVDGREGIGYVETDEVLDGVKVQLENGMERIVHLPNYNYDNDEWEYDNDITFYWPFKFRINKLNGSIDFVFSRFKVDNNNRITH